MTQEAIDRPGSVAAGGTHRTGNTNRSDRTEAKDPRPAIVARMLRKAADAPFDLIVIGGGATGLGVAVDASLRGLSVALLEASDFAKGTSSRATKLLHGGVRYLAQGNIGLVREALQERTTLLDIASHLAQPLPFLMPVYGRRGRWLEKPFYGAGLVLYDLMAGRHGIGKTAFLDRDETLARMPGVKADRLSGSVQYWDGQFDDARLAIALARTAAAQDACLLNHCKVVALTHDVNGRVIGVQAQEAETKRRFELRGNCVVNATGVWVDAIRRMDHQPGGDIVAPSQGVHIVVDRDFLPGDHALLVPRTRDGRVLFAVPWLGKTILGTTDTARKDLAAEPTAFPQEIDFILTEAGRYLAKAPTRADVRSIWVGLRPLVKPPSVDDGGTKSLSREHTVMVASSGLVTVTGGKWTTYRAMAEDVLAQCMERKLIRKVAGGASARRQLVGAPKWVSLSSNSRRSQPTGRSADVPLLTRAPGLHLYGTDASRILELPGAGTNLAEGLTEAMVRFAVREEFARDVEDVLARRSRLLFLDARQASVAAPRVAVILAEELGSAFDAAAALERFRDLAKGYQVAG